MESSLPNICIDKDYSFRPPIQYAESQTGQKVHENLRAAMIVSKMWPQGRPLKIRFLEGDSSVQNKVKEMAMDWTNYATIKFEFVDDLDADVQISFKKGAGSWSAIGTDASLTNPGIATMNFGWFDANTPDKEISRTTKHEFGHALGLVHEHQNPAGGINWNKQAVIDSLSKPPNSWDLATINHNMFERYSKNITNYTNLDSSSIMTYFVPSEYTTDGKSIGFNVFDLSQTDKDFIKQMYK
jgi:serralysin